MPDLYIKAETFPKRCEVCHQADCFDPQKNYCVRCDGVSPLTVSNIKEERGLNRSVLILLNFLSEARAVIAWVIFPALISMLIADQMTISINPNGNGPWPDPLPRPPSFQMWLIWRNISFLVTFLAGIISLPKRKAIVGLTITILYILYSFITFSMY